MDRRESFDLFASTHLTLFQQTAECGDALDPNGVIDALVDTYVTVYEAAEWDVPQGEVQPDIVQDIIEWVEAYLERREERRNAERDSGSGYLGEGDQT